jgi:hypothetical protein
MITGSLASIALNITRNIRNKLNIALLSFQKNGSAAWTLMQLAARPASAPLCR